MKVKSTSNEPGQATGIIVEEHFGDGDHNSLSFKIVLNREKAGPCPKVLN